MYTLTRADAARRSQAVELDSVEVHLDLSRAGDPTETSYPVTSVIGLTLREPETFLDVVGEVREVLVGEDPLPVEHDGARLWLRGLPTDRPLQVTVHARCNFSRTGEGLHRYVDPEDARTYLYTQFEPADARRAWPCLDQPDLKARWTFHVTAPEQWVVASNGAESRTGHTPARGAGPDDPHTTQGSPQGARPSPATRPTASPSSVIPTRTHHFCTTPPLSSYITAVVAGEWAVVEGGTWSGGANGEGGDGGHVEIPLRLMCRRALAPHVDSEDLLAVTRAGLDFYHRHYGTTYPWGTYDQVFVPEYNLGAMENPGCVTFNEHYLSRDTPTFAQRQDRANTILHEMCHMWFGDLVTPRWWGDLWLKESFADHQGTFAAAAATPYTGEWAAFAVGRKAWAYEQDQYPTTHPIAADVPDLDAAKNNFDGITYAKGAAVLKQLVAWVGEEAFFAGARAYFRDHAFSSATLRDLLAALTDASGVDLSQWEELWLHTCGPSVLQVRTDIDEGGAVRSLDLLQAPARGGEAVLRPHSLVVSTWALRGGALERTHRFPVRTHGEHAPVDPDGVLDHPGAAADLDLVVVNDEDLTYAVARLDERSTATALSAIGTCGAPLTRAVVWASLWNAVRDGLTDPRALVHSILAQAPQEGADAVAERLLAMALVAMQTYTRGSRREDLVRTGSRRALELLEGGALAPDRARSWARFLTLMGTGSRALPEDAVHFVERLASSQAPGVTVGPELAWRARTALASTARVDRADLDDWLQAAPTGEARTWHARSVAALPDADVRQRAWSAVVSGDLSNETMSATLWGLAHSAWQGEGTQEAFLREVLGFWADHSIGMGIRFVNGAFPDQVDIDEPSRCRDTQELLERWIRDHQDAPAALRRLMVEGVDDRRRAISVQEAW